MNEDLTILTDEKHEREDLKMILMAVRRRWPIPETKKAQIVTRMLDIVSRRTVDLHFESGPRPSEERADANAIKAAAILAALEGQNQSDEHAADKNARLDAGKLTDRTEVVEVELKFDNAG